MQQSLCGIVYLIFLNTYKHWGEWTLKKNPNEELQNLFHDTIAVLLCSYELGLIKPRPTEERTGAFSTSGTSKMQCIKALCISTKILQGQFLQQSLHSFWVLDFL